MNLSQDVSERETPVNGIIKLKSIGYEIHSYWQEY